MHKTHLLLLLANGMLRNKICNDRTLQACLFRCGACLHACLGRVQKRDPPPGHAPNHTLQSRWVSAERASLVFVNPHGFSRSYALV